MKTRIILAILLTLMFAGNATATGYVGGTASHTTLYSDTIRGKTGAKVTVNDELNVIVGSSSARLGVSDGGVEGTSGTILGRLGTTSASVYGKNGGTIASMATASEAVIGTHSGGNYARLGTANEGIYTRSSNGNEARIAASDFIITGKNSAASTEAYLGGASYAVYGINGNNNGWIGGSGAESYGVYGKGTRGIYGEHVTSGNYGYLGGSTIGVYGSGSGYGIYGDCNGCTYGFYTIDKLRASAGIDVGSSASCTDYTPGPGSSSGNCALNDVAEDIYSKDELESGDVVVIDENNNEHVRLSSKPYDTLAAGIISSSPAFHIQTSETGIPLALAGRVKAKASAENGAIKRGDLLITSSTPGHLMKCDDKAKCIGAIVGKAMEPLAKGKGKISVLVALG